MKNQSKKRRPAESGGDNSSDLIWTQTDRRHDLVLLSLARNPFYDPADLLSLARNPLYDPASLLILARNPFYDRIPSGFKVTKRIYCQN